MVKTQNINIAKMLEAAAREIRNNKYGDLDLNDSVTVVAASNYKAVSVKKGSVIRPQPTNKKIIGNPFFWRK